MPKFIPNYNEWAFSKHCGHCGKSFYPIEKSQDFCDHWCEVHWKDYCKDVEAMWMDDLYKEDEKYGF